MCEFKLCRGKHACFLANVSPCPEYEIRPIDGQTSETGRRVISRIGFAGAVDVANAQPCVGRRNKLASRVA